MKSNQQGFTLIELVMVIVILGILAATAIPRFVNLAGEATIAAAKGVAGGAASASAINYAASAAGNAAAINTTGVGGTAVGAGGCDSVTVGALLNDGLPAEYSIAYNGAGALGDAAAFGDTWTCKVQTAAGVDILDGGATITFTLHYVP